jgi:hypothetical protein
MTIIVSVKISDGIVMAADSATTLFIKEGLPVQIYEHANKIVNLVKGLPIGVMTCGAGGIGSTSIATLLKDLRQQLAGKQDDLKLPADYTMALVASRVHRFFAEKATAAGFLGSLLLRICGYSTNRPLPEVWQVNFIGGSCTAPEQVQSETDFRPLWDGQPEALNRLIYGSADGLSVAVASALGLDAEQAKKADAALYSQHETLILPAAPIQDAIDLARYMIETTKGFVRFSVTRVKTVGGPVEIAAITKHEGFKWVQRKHFFAQELNR